MRPLVSSLITHRSLLVLLLLLAFILRVAYWERSASFGSYELAYDDDEYFKLASLFARGEFFTDPYPARYTRAPGISFFIAPILAAFDEKIEIALYFQVGVSVLMVALAYAAARRAFGKSAALWATGLLAVAPIYAATAGSFILTETLFSFGILLFLYLWARWTQTNMTLPRALVAGLILGFTVLIRPGTLYFVPFALLWFLIATYLARRQSPISNLQSPISLRRDILSILVLLFGVFTIILPYTARNYVAYDRYLLVDAAGGWTLWRDHRTPDDDFWTTLPTIPNPADRDRYAFSRGVQNILADPVYQLGVQGVANLGSVFRLELDSFARGAGYLNDVMVDAPTLPLVLLNDLYYLFVVIVGVAGMLLHLQRVWQARRAGQRLTPQLPSLLLVWLGYYLLLVALFHMQTRFRPHYTFVLLLFAGAALAHRAGLWRALNRPLRVAWVAVALVALVLAYSPRLAPLAMSEYYLAQANGRDIAAAKRAVATFPEYTRAHDTLGDAYRYAGDFPNALAAYATALAQNPFEMQAHLGRMDVFRQQGDTAALAAQVQAAGAVSGELDVPAPLWWSFDPAPTRLIELGDSAASFGYALNFHAIQPDGDERLRFTQARSFLKFPGVRDWEPQSLVLYARAVPLPDQPLPTVLVRLNDRIVSLPLTAEWRDHVIPLTPADLASDTLIVELVSPTFRPIDTLPNSTDPRELGFMLSYAELR